MVRSGKTVSEVARYFGYTKGAVSKWCKKYPANGAWIVPTGSSRPKHHPSETPPAVVRRIKELRLALGGRCAEVIQKHLADEGIRVHRITVQRVLDRLRLTNKRSPWKRFRKNTARPVPTKPGNLVQVDTVHLIQTKVKRIYVYTLIDVYSRWAYAWATEKANARMSVLFLRKAQRAAPFTLQCIQSDNGPEFSSHFTERIKITHRHSRVRQPNDNAHLERFNRTIQHELICSLKPIPKVLNRHIPKYLDYYNTRRYHLGINLKTPAEIIQECFQGIV
jgi:transposase InsO family protein